jgi:hypothetical protein
MSGGGASLGQQLLAKVNGGLGQLNAKTNGALSGLTGALGKAAGGLASSVDNLFGKASLSIGGNSASTSAHIDTSIKAITNKSFLKTTQLTTDAIALYMPDTLAFSNPQTYSDLKPGLERLLLSMYTYIPPVRADYFDVRINPPKSVIDNSKDNFIVFDKTHPEKSVLVIRDFKTANKYKEIKHALPLQLYKEIQLSLTEKPRDYLFVMPTNATRPYDRGSFSKWANKVLQSLFNVSITLTSLRHLFVSTLDFNNTRASELEKIGNSMGHSIAMQKGYQWIQ